MFIYLTLKCFADSRKIVFGQGRLNRERFINGILVRIFMVDIDAVNLVREALKSGKSQNEVVVLMKQAGYTDQSIADVLAEAKKGSYPADELARRIAEKNNIPLQQSMPKLGPPTLPSQPPILQPMPVPSSGIDKSIIGMFKLSIDAFLHPADTSKKIKGTMDMGDGAKMMALCGVFLALIFSVFMLIVILALSSIASTVASVNLSAFFVSWIVSSIGMIIAMPVGLLIGWVIGAGIWWISAKILGGTRSYSEFASEMVFPQIGISLASIVVFVIEFVIMLVIALNAMAALVSAITNGGIFAIFGAIAAFTSTMMIGFIITGLMSLVFGIYALYVFVAFMRESMEMSTLRAVIAIFLPIIVVFILGVVASIGVWMWISPLTGAPSGFTPTYPDGTGGTTQYSLVVTSAYKNYTSGECISMDIKNNGGLTIPSDVIFEIKEADGTSTGKYVVIRSELNSGETGNFDIVSSPFDSSAKSSVPLGSYILRLSLLSDSGSGTSDTYFTC